MYVEDRDISEWNFNKIEVEINIRLHISRLNLSIAKSRAKKFNFTTIDVFYYYGKLLAALRLS